MKRARGWLLVVAALSCAAARATWADESLCDPRLAGETAGGSLSYKRRADRCEGTYAAPVAGATLLLVSLTESFADFDAAADKFLRLEWSSSATEGTRLRAYSLRPTLHYQMDTFRPPGNGSYEWPTDVLRELALTRRDMGIVGWAVRRIGTRDRIVYLPLRAAPGSPLARSRTYRLVVVPGEQLDKLSWGLTSVGDDGAPRAVVYPSHSLGDAYLPAERPIAISVELPETAAGGTYRIQLTAEFEAGLVSTPEIWFQHSAP